jgi:hypothetical protein
MPRDRHLERTMQRHMPMLSTTPIVDKADGPSSWCVSAVAGDRSRDGATDGGM